METQIFPILVIVFMLVMRSFCDPLCLSPLGVSSGTVKDSHMKASSSFSPQTVGAINGRLGTERGGGAWCPAGLVSESQWKEEWLEVDFGRSVHVTGMITQGRFAGGHCQEFAECIDQSLLLG